MTDRSPNFHHRCDRRAVLRGVGAAAITTLAPLPALAQAGRSPRLRTIPRTAERVPAIGLGTFETFDISPGEKREHLGEVLRRFHAAGGRLVDTSPLYGMAEAVVGDYAHSLGIADDIFFANKTWSTGEYLSDNSQSEAQLRRSTERLWRQRMDLMQVHSLENVDQVLHLFRRWKAEGRTRFIGITHWNAEYYDTLERLVRTGQIDFAQFNYSILSRRAEERLLPACADSGVAVLINMPFEKARLFTCVRDRKLPDFAAEIGVATWAQFFLKFVIAHPAVTAAIPATSVPDHVSDNMGALYGPLPDQAMRERMASYMTQVPGFDATLRQPPYPGRQYGGVVTWPFK